MKSEKPASTIITFDQVNAQMAEQLNNYMNKNKPWLNPKLSLYDLAKDLNFTSHQLTSLLNDYLKTKTTVYRLSLDFYGLAVSKLERCL